MATLDGYITSANPPKRNRHSTGTVTTAASTIDPTDLTIDDDDGFDDVVNGNQLISSLSSAAATFEQHRNNDNSTFAPWSRQQVYSLLEQRFKIQNFRDKQEAIIQSTLRGQDVFVIMRTGGGMYSRYNSLDVSG